MSVEDLTGTLISFHTESPAGNEEECARFLGDYVHDLHLDGFRADLHRFEPRRANLVVRVGSSKEPGILLSGHVDTVQAGDLSEWSGDPFQARVKNGLLYGRGAADMKAGVACLTKALESIRGKRLSRNLMFVCTAGEENGCIGLTRLLNEHRIGKDECKWGIDAEPTEVKVVRKHRGVTRFRVTLGGRNAHASTPQLGVNAVENASRFIEEIRRYRSELATQTDAELGATVLPVTLIEGGVKGRYNVVPDKCEFFINCRTVPLHSAEKILKDLISISESIKSADKDFDAQISIDFNSNSLQVEPQSEIVRLAERAVGQRSTWAPYGTEASLYTEFGIPTIVLGPGSVRQAHTIDEFVSLKETEKAVSAYERIIESVCV